jgi:hypothetical protein
MSSISIVTSVGGIYGTGHASRMAFLAEFLAEKGHRVSVICPVQAGRIIPPLKPFIKDSIPAGTKLIIRDMRDSVPDEIQLLKKEAPVIAVDDCGTGRNSADMIIDCLPNLLNSSPLPPLEKSPFLFGHSFVEYLNENRNQTFVKNIDICLYAGQNPDDEYFSKILSAIPLTAQIENEIRNAFPNLKITAQNETIGAVSDTIRTICITGKGHPLIFGEDAQENAPHSFPEALLRSHAVVTHFGITLFEAFVCGCTLYTVNPSDYHSRLCERVKDSLDLVNFGIADKLDLNGSKNSIASGAYASKILNAEDIIHTINRCAENFYSRMIPLLQD